MKKILIVFSVAAISLNSIGQTCFPLDNTFGVNGRSIGHATSVYMSHANIVVLPDGKILQFSSNSTNGLITAKHKANGGLDSTFGVNGKSMISLGSGTYAAFGSVHSDGKIIIVGAVQPGNYQKIAIVRLNSNGTPDVNFGNNGVVISSISNQNDQANGVAIQPDGKILVAGFSSGVCFTDCIGYTFCKQMFTVARYQVNGNIDSTFGQNGKVIFGIGSFDSGSAYSVVVQPDGKIVVAGESRQYYCDDYYGGSSWYSGFFMTRLGSNGTVDGSFGLNGQVRDTIDLLNTAGFAMQQDGKFVVMGYKNNSGYMVRRYNSDGSVDNSFNQNIVFNHWMSALSLAGDGKVIVAGQTYISSEQDFFVARLKHDGTFDSSFNLEGKVSVNLSPSSSSEERVTGVASQGNQVIVGGGIYNSSNPNERNQVIIRLSDPLTGLNIGLTPSGSLYPCYGVTLNSSLQGNHQWYKNNQLMPGAVNPSLYVTTSGSYSVKVTNANGCGLSNALFVGINGLPVNIMPASSTNICQGDSVKLITQAQLPVQWYRNGTPINNATDSILWAKNSGSYHVTVSNSSGCGYSGTIYVNVSPAKPAVNWTGTHLNTTTGFGGYQWYLNGNAIPGATTPTLLPATTGLYKVSISNFPCNTMSDEFNLSCNVITVQKPIITWTGAQMSVPNSYGSYQWYFNNNPIPNANSYYVIINQTGVYKVVVTGQLGCSNTSNDYTLTCNEAGPAKPPINWNGIQFSTNTGYANYQWFYNDTAIVGANSFAYTPVTAKFGRYKVEVANAFNCTSFSDERFYSPTDIVTLGQVKFTYYPNPVKGTFFIDILQASLKTMRAVVYDLNGKKLVEQNLRLGQNQVQVKGLASGLYHLEIMFGNEKSVLKLAVIQ